MPTLVDKIQTQNQLVDELSRKKERKRSSFSRKQSDLNQPIFSGLNEVQNVDLKMVQGTKRGVEDTEESARTPALQQI